MIAGGAWLASAGGQEGLEAFGTGPSAEISGWAHRAGDGTNEKDKPPALAGRLDLMVRSIFFV